VVRRFPQAEICSLNLAFVCFECIALDIASEILPSPFQNCLAF